MSEPVCPTCGRSDFASETGMKTHHKKAHGESISGVQLTCEECGDTYRKKAVYAEDSKYCSIGCKAEATRTRPEPEYECPTCDKLLRSEQGVKQHHTQAHGIRLTDELEVPDGPECPTCGDRFQTQEGMHRHHFHIHGESIARVTHVCSECGREREVYESELERLESGMCVDCSREREIPHTEEAKQKISAANEGRELSEEQHKALMEGWREWWEEEGWDNDEFRERKLEQLKEGREKIKNSPEIREQISETLMGHDVPEETRQKIRENWSAPSKMMVVEETGHEVRSTWEKEIDLLLWESDFDYEYEPKRFDIGSSFYLPDFQVGEDIIEVKGYVYDASRERAELFLEHYPEFRYIVVGAEHGAEVPCDRRIPWDDREQLLEVLDE